MNSPPSDANSPFAHYQNNWILPEESIVFSQPCLFLLDMEKEKKQEFQKDAQHVEKRAVEKIEKAVVSKKERGLQIQKAAKQTKKVNTAKINKTAVSNKGKAQKNEGEEKKMVETEEEKTKEEEKKVATTSVEHVKKHLSRIMEMEESALKALCKDKGILTTGRSTMKHKYAFALIRDALMQL